MKNDGIKWILKSDDDILLNLDQLQNYIDNEANSSSIHGYMYHGSGAWLQSYSKISENIFAILTPISGSSETNDTTIQCPIPVRIRKEIVHGIVLRVAKPPKWKCTITCLEPSISGILQVSRFLSNNE